MDALSGSTPSRKRRNDNVEDEDSTYYQHSPEVSTSSKRLQNSRGQPIARETLTYNTHPLLSSLATTRLFVTANFSVYDPASSSVLLCVMREDDAQYRSLCKILQGLYSHAPTLQALAIVAKGQVETSYWQALQRTLPIVRVDDLDEEAAYDLSAFLAKLDVSADVAVLVDASGKCPWTSDELELYDTADSNALRQDLERVLSRTGLHNGEAMDLGW